MSFHCNIHVRDTRQWCVAFGGAAAAHGRSSGTSDFLNTCTPSSPVFWFFCQPVDGAHGCC